MKPTIVALDFSEPSLAALDEALRRGATPETLHVIHVLQVLHPGAPEATWEPLNDEQRKERAREALRKILDERGLQAVQAHTDIGDPGRGIVNLAKELGAGLVVIATEGRTGLGRLLLGSVAERVVRLSPCSVLVVRRPHPK